MSQQVNLYQPIFRQQRKVFSAATMLQIVAVVALGLAALYGFARWQAAGVAADLAALEAQRATAQAQLDAMTATLAERRDIGALTAQITAVEQQLAGRRKLLQWLREHGQGAGAGGFSALLEGLAREHRSGLSLTTIALGNDGEQRRIRLEGEALEPTAVVEFLQRLGREPAFADLEFRTVRFERDPVGPVGFVVDSEREASTP